MPERGRLLSVLAMACGVAALAATGGVDAGWAVTALTCLIGTTLIAAGVARWRTGQRSIAHAGRLLALWSATAVAAAVLAGWPLARLTAAPSLGGTLLVSAGIGALLVLLWRVWPDWQALHRLGQRAGPIDPADRPAWRGLGVALAVAGVAIPAVLLAWPGVLATAWRLPVALLLAGLTLPALWIAQGIRPARPAPVRAPRFAAPDFDMHIAHVQAEAASPALADNVVALIQPATPMPAPAQTELPDAAAAEPVAPAVDVAALTAALYTAARHGRVAQALELLEQGADAQALPPDTDRDRRSLPVLAAVLPDLRLLRALIERGIDVNAAHAGMRPLLAATRDSWHGRPDAVMMLLANGADPLLADAEGNTPMHHAARSADPGVAAMLCDAAAPLDTLNDEGVSPLFTACAGGNWRLARFLLERGAKAEPADGQPALIAAAGSEDDDPAGVQLLLRHRAKADARDRHGRGALHAAASAGHAEVTQVLLEAGADVQARDAAGRTPLLDAAAGGHDAVAALLLQAGADPRAVDHAGSTALHLTCAADGSSPALLRRLLDAGSDPAVIDAQSQRASDIAAARGRWPLVQLLEPARPLPTALRDDDADGRPPSLLLRERLLQGQLDGDTALLAQALRPAELSSLLGDADLNADAARVRWLLAHGADAHAGARDGMPALSSLLMQGVGAADAIRALLERGAAPAGRGGLAGFLAASQGHPDPRRAEDLALDLLQRGADAFGSNANGDVPLTLAVRLDWPRLQQALIDMGVNLDARDGRGMTPLHLAAIFGHTEALKRLVAAGADPQQRAGDGQTPLGVALAAGRRDLADWLDWRGWRPRGRAMVPSDLPAAAIPGDHAAVRRLLDLGLPVNATDAQGCTALLRAAGGGHRAVVELLLARGADPALAASTGATPLSAAVSMRHVEIVERLLGAGADLEQRLPGEVTVLMLACALGHPDLAARLLQAGADIHVRDGQGLTPLHCATLYGFSSRERARLLALLDTLLLAGADADAVATNGTTPLLLLLGARAEPGTPCSEDVLLAALERLLDEDVRLDARDARGFGPLHLAGLHGLLRVAQALLRAGADANARDALGRSPREVALMRGYVDVAAELTVGDPGTGPGSGANAGGAVSMARLLRDRR